MRRGAPSANSRWDNSVAILTGDFLFAHASRLVADLGPAAVRIIAETFAELVTGQMRETRGPRPGDDPVEHYLTVIAEKTGSLIATSGRYGGMFSGCTPDAGRVAAPLRRGDRHRVPDLRRHHRHHLAVDELGQDPGHGPARGRAHPADALRPAGHRRGRRPAPGAAGPPDHGRRRGGRGPGAAARRSRRHPRPARCSPSTPRRPARSWPQLPDCPAAKALASLTDVRRRPHGVTGPPEHRPPRSRARRRRLPALGCVPRVLPPARRGRTAGGPRAPGAVDARADGRDPRRRPRLGSAPVAARRGLGDGRGGGGADRRQLGSVHLRHGRRPRRRGRPRLLHRPARQRAARRGGAARAAPAAAVDGRGDRDRRGARDRRRGPPGPVDRARASPSASPPTA